MGSIRDHVEDVFVAAAFAERGEQQEAILLLKRAAAPEPAVVRPAKKQARPSPAARAD